MCFLDIEGTFNVDEVIIHIQWIGNMLKNKMVSINSLLRNLERMEVAVIGYAADIAILITGKFLL